VSPTRVSTMRSTRPRRTSAASVTVSGVLSASRSRARPSPSQASSFRVSGPPCQAVRTSGRPAVMFSARHLPLKTSLLTHFALI